MSDVTTISLNAGRITIGQQPWQPIDTAPRDGTQFLGWNGVRRVIASWADPYWEEQGAFADDGCHFIDPPLTRWTALLEPPA